MLDGKRLIRNGSTVGLIGVLSVAVAGLGVAAASNGGSLALGHHNSATKTTTLTDKKGTPLALIGKKSKPPLTVNSSKLVKHLNAAEVGGLTAAQLRGTGSATDLGIAPNQAFSPSISVIVIPKVEGTAESPTFHTVKVISTAALPAGHYVVTGSGFGANAGCWIDSALSLSTPEDLFAFGAIGSSQPSSGSSTRAFTITKPTAVSMYCYGVSFDTDGYVADANIAAVPVGKVVTGTHAATTPLSGL